MSFFYPFFPLSHFMSSFATINITELCEASLIRFKTNSSLRSMKITIENETLVAGETTEINGTPEQDFNASADYFEKDKPSLLLIRIGKEVFHSEYVLIVYIPEMCQIRPRTIYASARIPIQRYMTRLFVSITDYFVDSISEVDFEKFLKVTKKDDSALSFDEILQKKEQFEMSVAQVQLPQHDSFVWPLSEELKQTLAQMASGNGNRIMTASGSAKGESVVLLQTCDSVSDLTSKSPFYIAYRYNDNGQDLKVFILYCPDSAKAREKMMSSTYKHSFIKGCEEAGIVFDKTFEIRDENELSETYIESLIHPEDVNHGYGEIKMIQKPKRPGRR